MIAEINDRFGAGLRTRIAWRSRRSRWICSSREDLERYARVNSEENYGLEFAPVFKDAILDQEERNRRLYELLLGKPELAAIIERELMRETYRELRGNPPTSP